MRLFLIVVLIRACVALRASDSELMFNSDQSNSTVTEPFVTLTVPAYTGSCDTSTCAGVDWLLYTWGVKNIDKSGHVQFVDDAAYEEGVQRGWVITKIGEKDFSREAWKETWPKGQSVDITFDCNGKPPPPKPFRCSGGMFASAQGKCLRNAQIVGWCKKKGPSILPIGIGAVPYEPKTPFLEKEDWPVYRQVLESGGWDCNPSFCYKWSAPTCIRKSGLHMGMVTNMGISTSINTHPTYLDHDKTHHKDVQVPFEDERGTVERIICEYYHVDSSYYVPDPPAPCE